MTERWRKPVVPVASETTPNDLFWDGLVWRKDVEHTLTEEDYGRVEAGYVCVNCLEPQEKSFPKNCSLCNFEMRDRQARILMVDYRGKKDIGPSTTLQWELDRLDDEKERKSHKPGSSIWVPDAKT
jgi:hypothetical protein